MAFILRRRRLVAILAVLVVAAGLITWRIVANSTQDYRTDTFTFDSSAPAGDAKLDVTLYIPDGVDADNPAPAVILAHGFGGSKESVEADAVDLANRGYVVLAYSARGFGKSTGSITLDSPDGEVADARNLISMLGERPDVVKDGADDPRVGIAGQSYGGALALLTAGYDDRVDAIVPQITWNRLSRVFFPNGAGTAQDGGPASPSDSDTTPGAFKREWAGIFFGFGKGFDVSSLIGGATGSDGAAGDTADGTTAGAGTDTEGGVRPAGDTAGAEQLVCGRFDASICDVYTASAESGTLNDEGRAVLDKSSPWSVADKIKAPTFLIQGEADTLFPLSEADVNAQQIRSNGTDVKMMWSDGGHDAGGVVGDSDEEGPLRDQIAGWFDHYLKKTGDKPALDFSFAQQTGLSTGGSRATTRTQMAPSYPTDVSTRAVPLIGPAQPVLRPAGGVPASISSLPGLGSVAGLAYDPPGQVALFSSAELTEPVNIVGSSKVRLTVTGATDGITLFAKIYDSSGAALPSLPSAQVVPVVVPPSAAGTPVSVDVVLPAIAHRFETGHRIVVAVASTDRAYAGTSAQQIVQVELARGELAASSVSSTAAGVATSDWVWLIVALAGLGALGTLIGLLWRRGSRSRAIAAVDESLLEVPLVVRGLHKAYGDGFVAVRGIDFEVQRNQVVGLLGPNGAGKTTALRMLMGLIRPTDGEMRVFGHKVTVGAPVLSRLGCFVEGVGFLPHLSGRENIELYWAATGRPAQDARIAEVLEIAGLGKAIERKVRTYSQGMRQRLAIAQAMLGMPDLLILDEPTNGLDPPQIAEMRQVLRNYAGDGRSVLVSSHQLAEVEQTCTHVVVMNFGEVIANGTVDAVAGVGAEVDIRVDDPTVAAQVIEATDGVRLLETGPQSVALEVVDDEAVPGRVSAVVAALVAAGVGVESVMSRRRLEDAFLALVGGSPTEGMPS